MIPVSRKKLKTKTYTKEFKDISTSTNVNFNEMFPELNVADVITFNIEIINVQKTWDRIFANIVLETTSSSYGQLQIRSYAETQYATVRVTAFYRE